jgi:hypothetical protein
MATTSEKAGRHFVLTQHNTLSPARRREGVQALEIEAIRIDDA